MPGYGIEPGTDGLLPWSWAEQRLRDGHTYWLATADAEGSPHAMAVWGVWLDGAFLFSTGSRSRKARNLEANPRCVVAWNEGDVAVVLEGRASLLKDRHERARCVSAYDAKYPEAIPAGEPVYKVVPAAVFGIGEPPFAGTATRWTFQSTT